MQNLFLLPTEKPSRLVIYSTLVDEYRLLDKPIKDWKEKRHIYITSEDKVKENDWFLKPDLSMVFKALYEPSKSCKKIILTTDPFLIEDGVQAIDDEFLEWFIKNPSC